MGSAKRRARGDRGRRGPTARVVPVGPRLKIWVSFGERVKFGDGRADLLEAIDRLGSFKKAVEEFGMSYRAAWGYFRELERAAGVAFLERHPGGGPAGGTRLTPAARRFLQRYRRSRHRVGATIDRHFRESFSP